jgi:hypothetical protein
MNETLDRTEVETSKWSSIIDRVWSEWPEKSGKRIPDKDDNDVGAISYLIEKERKNKKKALTEKEVVTIVELYLTTLTKKVLSTQDKTTRAVMLAGILAMGLILV